MIGGVESTTVMVALHVELLPAGSVALQFPDEVPTRNRVVAQLAVQLDRARQEVSASGLQLRKMSGELEEVERELQTTTDDKERRALERGGIPDLKMRIKAQATADQALRERKNEALQALSTEQSRWQELNSRLDELERLLAPIPR